MARKKSAAKKAKEAEAKLKPEVSEPVTDEKPKSKPKKQAPPSESSESSESEESEEEDEYGDLVTENVDKGINKVLEALRTDPSKLLDKNVKFYDEEDFEVTEKTEKPMYLKDYHRMNLLSGDYKHDDEEENEHGTVDGKKPFVVAEREEREQLLSDIKNAFNEDEDDEEDEDDGFLKKRTNTKPIEPATIQLPDSKNQEEFLKSFLDQKAWVPTKNDKVIDLDRHGEDDEEFDDAVEKFESAYNFRYEEENAAEIISYARDQATVRRDKSNSRKRQRERKNEEKVKELEVKQEKIKKKETQKLNKVTDRLSKIKQELGGDIKDDVIAKVFGDSLLNDDFDDTDWDNKMAEIFNEQYYNDDVTKPKFSDMELDDDEPMDADEPVNDGEQEADEPPKKKSKKDKLKEKKASKKEKVSVKEKAQEIIEANKTRIVEEVEEEEQRGRSQDDDTKFKYREVSPESYGLTTRDIFVADDKQLNEYIGIKKFAPYREKESRIKDRRKYKKKRLLQEWRKEVFKDYNPQKEDDDNTIWIPEKKHKKKHKK